MSEAKDSEHTHRVDDFVVTLSDRLANARLNFENSGFPLLLCGWNGLAHLGQIYSTASLTAAPGEISASTGPACHGEIN
jgi:hypothetical protein